MGLSVWTDYLALLRNVSDPISTPHNFTPGRDRLPARRCRAASPPRSRCVELRRGGRGRWSRRAARLERRPRTSSRSRRASCCRRSSGTITRCSCSCPSRTCSSGASGGRCSCRWRPAVFLIGVTPAAAYPIAFWVDARRARRGRAARGPRPERRREPAADAASPRDRIDSTERRVVGLRRRRRRDGDLLAVEPLLRRPARRLLLPRRRLPPRPDVVRPGHVPLGAIGPNDVIPIERPLLRAVRAVPGDLLHAARRDHRARSPPTSGRPGSTRRSRRSTSASAGGCSGGVGVRSLVDRFWLVALLGFSTQIWWVTTRGGVWHTGQLIATMLTLACLIELWGSRRAWLIGLMAGAAFLTPGAARLRGPVLRAAPRRRRGLGAAPLAVAVVGRARPPASCRRSSSSSGTTTRGSGRRFESGYALATLPPWLEDAAPAGPVLDRPHPDEPRLPVRPPADAGSPTFPWLKPDGLGMSILITSPGLLYAVRAPWRESRTWWLLGAARRGPRPDAPLLRRRLAPVRLPLRARLDPVRLRAVRPRRRARRARPRVGRRLGGPGIGPGWRLLIVVGLIVGLGRRVLGVPPLSS